MIRVVFEDDSNLFGLPLSDVCRRERRSLPFIITKCVNEIDTRGLHVGAEPFAPPPSSPIVLTLALVLALSASRTLVFTEPQGTSG